MTEAAKEAARRLYKRYNFSNGPFATYELSSLMTDTYDSLKIPFNPSQRDIKAYEKILDADGDGKVSLSDLEAKAIEYLCGPGVLAEAPKKDYTSSYNFEVQPAFTTSHTTQSFTNYRENTSYESQQVYESHGYSDYSSQAYQKEEQHHGQQERQPEGREEKRPYSQAVWEYLAVVGKVFMNYADPSDYTVTETEVPSLLSDTYAVLGREDYYPSEEDVRAWMKLCDVNNDGKVEFQDYEFFVVKSLERSGLNLYDQ